ncbi:MAG: hypothetical protein HDQ87_07640 [Clostridia bacterium]|nr:hypothetical protein [Clostridia bacterium]
MKDYTKRKTGFSRIVASMCLIVMISAPSTACQKAPTSESPVTTDSPAAIAVEQTDTDAAPSVPQSIEVPEYVEQSPTEIANLELEIDADVTVPQDASFLLLEVEPRNLTVTDVQTVVETATGIAAPVLYSQYEPGRDYWDRKLTEAVESGSASTEYIESLEQKRSEAPEQTEKTVFDGAMPSDSDGAGMYLYFENGSEVGSLNFLPGGNLVSLERDITEHAMPESAMDAESGEVIRDEPVISEEEARKEAEACRDKLAPDLTEVFVEPCLITSSGRGQVTGWRFVFTRSVADLQKTFFPDSFYINPESAPTVAAPWTPEQLIVTVDDRGIVALMWTGASDPTGAEPEDASLVPFSDIQQQAVTQLGYMYGPMENGDGQGMKLTITDFSLGTEMLAAADNPEMGVYTPVWAVSYDYSYGGASEMSHGQIFLDAQNGRYVEPRVTTAYLMEYQ